MHNVGLNLEFYHQFDLKYKTIIHKVTRHLSHGRLIPNDCEIPNSHCLNPI